MFMINTQVSFLHRFAFDVDLIRRIAPADRTDSSLTFKKSIVFFSAKAKAGFDVSVMGILFSLVVCVVFLMMCKHFVLSFATQLFIKVLQKYNAESG
jgi:hypothetical protein